MTADYAFWISGRLTPELAAVLEPLKSVETSADTLLVGPVTDRAALHGYIAHLEALGLELVGLRRLRPAMTTALMDVRVVVVPEPAYGPRPGRRRGRARRTGTRTKTSQRTRDTAAVRRRAQW